MLLVTLAVLIISVKHATSQCGSPGISFLNRNNGNFNATDQSSYSDGTSVKYTCDQGFAQVGHSIRTCIRSEWNYNIPKCSKYAETAPPCNTLFKYHV